MWKFKSSTVCLEYFYVKEVGVILGSLFQFMKNAWLQILCDFRNNPRIFVLQTLSKENILTCKSFEAAFFHANLCACMIFINYLKIMMIFVARVYWWFSLSMSYYECEILATTSSRFEAGLCRNILTVPMAHEDAFKVLIKKKSMLSNVRLLSHHICNGQKLLANNK